MIEGKIPSNEKQRIERLKSYNILDSLPEKEYDAITQIASHICDTPVALISFVDEERQWFKSHHGLPASEISRSLSFCSHAINEPDKILIVPDATKDKRFFDNPLATGSPYVIFYAGTPLKTPDGLTLGTLCVIDSKPREGLTKAQQDSLKALANQVMSQLELRKNNKELETANLEINRLNNQLEHFAYRLAHDLKSPVGGIKSLIDMINDEYLNDIKDPVFKKYLGLIDSRSIYMDTLINEILQYTRVTNNKINYTEFSISETLQYIEDNCVMNIPTRLEMINCDHKVKLPKTGFTQIFQNLISNSKKFTDKSEVCITITFKEDRKKYFLSYEDNGPGIPEKYWKKAFVMFETLGNQSYKNSGIGLATIKSVLERIGGTIRLTDKLVKESGVRFEIDIPKTNLMV